MKFYQENRFILLKHIFNQKIDKKSYFKEMLSYKRSELGDEARLIFEQDIYLLKAISQTIHYLKYPIIRTPWIRAKHRDGLKVRDMKKLIKQHPFLKDCGELMDNLRDSLYDIETFDKERKISPKILLISAGQVSKEISKPYLSMNKAGKCVILYVKDEKGHVQSSFFITSKIYQHIKHYFIETRGSIGINISLNKDIKKILLKEKIEKL